MDGTVARRGWRGRGLAAAACAALASSATGCSWTFVVRAPTDSPDSVPNWARQSPDCTTSRVVPSVDTTVAALSGVAGAVVLAREPPGSVWKSAGPILLGTTAAVFVMSAIDGFKATNRCRDYRQVVRSESPAPKPPLGPAQAPSR